MRAIFLLVMFLFVLASMMIGGSVAVEYGVILPDNLVSAICIAVSFIVLVTVWISYFLANKQSFTDLIPVIALAGLIIFASLFLIYCNREVPGKNTSAKNSNVTEVK